MNVMMNYGFKALQAKEDLSITDFQASLMRPEETVLSGVHRMRNEMLKITEIVTFQKSNFP